MAKRKAATEEQPTPEAKPAASDDYTVLARRYRPQQFSDLVGQEPVAQALMNAVQSHRVAHAYLFTGARGVGKTSTARILAKALNCAKGPTTTPCDECDQCRAIASGEDVDVLEIDGASNNGVDEVREIRQNVQYRPSRSRYKIYIIDEVHMLSKPAFNALLKTLEEPPPHVKFIFATTEVQKIPATILSRCQRFDFAGIGLNRIVERLRQIVKAEGMHADAEALELIARRAGGSMRDAQSLLDQLLSFGDERLTLDSIHRLLGTAHEERVAALAEAVLRRDAKEALRQLADIVNQGQQLGELLDQLIDYWRDLMVVQAAGIEGQDLSVSGAQRDQLREHASRLKLDSILAGLDILVGAKIKMRTTTHVRVVLELALVRLSQLEDLIPLTQLTRWLQQDGGPSPAPAKASPALMRPGNGTAAAASDEKKKVSPPGEPEPSVAFVELNEANFDGVWTKVLAEVGFAVAGDLKKAASLAISGPNNLVMRFSQQYNSSGRFLEAERLARVEEALKRLTGQSWTVQVEFVQDEPVNPTVPAPANPAGPSRDQRVAIMQLPLVKKAIDFLGAQYIRADEGFGTPINPTAAPAGDEADEE